MTKFSNKVVTTSSAPNRVFSNAGTAMPAAPAAAPKTMMIGTNNTPGTSSAPVPMATAAIAPRYNCPSAPIFHSLARNAKAAASPVKISGVARVSISENANIDPNTPRNIWA